MKTIKKIMILTQLYFLEKKIKILEQKLAETISSIEEKNHDIPYFYVRALAAERNGETMREIEKYYQKKWDLVFKLGVG